MKITPDTNVLVRLLTKDDAHQNRIARATLGEADLVVLVLPTLCELAWVLSSSYRIASADIAQVIRGLVDSENVTTNRPAVEAGLAMLEAGGDFVDGVIAYEGRSLGADVFVSFDRKAVKLVGARGEKARLLS